jgi:hypothetical protein
MIVLIAEPVILECLSQSSRLARRPAQPKERDMREKSTPFEYLLKCSEMSLEDFELARLDRAASLRRQLRDIAEEWVDAAVEAQLARWVRENRRRTAARPAKFRQCDLEESSERQTPDRRLSSRKLSRNAPSHSLPPAVPVGERERFRVGDTSSVPRRQRRESRDASSELRYWR